MNNLFGSRKIYALGSLLLGVLLLLWPGNALRLASYVTGVIVMAGGITTLIGHSRNRGGGAGFKAGVFTSILVTFAGIWIFLNPEDFASVIPTVIGYLMVLSGIVNLLETFSLSRARYKKWWVSLLAAVVTIFMGMLMVNHAFGIASIMIRIVAVFLLFNGISDLWINKRVDEYVVHGQNKGGQKGGRAAAQGAGGRDTSDPDIIDAEDYREL